MSASVEVAPAPARLVLQPLNTNMSLREQAYAALKQATVSYTHLTLPTIYSV